jgi:hypothetical protein
MRALPYLKNLMFLWVVLCKLTIVVMAEKVSFNKKTSELSGVLLSKDFGMATGGVIEIDFKINPSDSTLNFSSYVLINIVTNEQLTSWYSSLQLEYKELGSSTANKYCMQPANSRQLSFGMGNFSYVVPAVDRYSVIVLQCRQGYESNPVSIDVHACLTNPRPSSSSVSHLPIDEVMIPRVLEGSAIIFGLMLAGLVGQMYTGRYCASYHVLFAA